MANSLAHRTTWLRSDFDDEDIHKFVTVGDVVNYLENV